MDTLSVPPTATSRTYFRLHNAANLCERQAGRSWRCAYLGEGDWYVRNALIEETDARDLRATAVDLLTVTP